MVVDTVDKEDPAAPPGNEPDALSNVKSTGEARRIDGFASINGYDGIWHPADKSDGADAAGADLADEGGDGPSDNASDGATTRPPGRRSRGSAPNRYETFGRRRYGAGQALGGTQHAHAHQPPRSRR